jgi:hypothetical protein
MKPRWKNIEEAYRLEGCILDSKGYDYDEDDTQPLLEKYTIDKDTITLPVFIWLDESDEEYARMNGEVEAEKLIETIQKGLNKESINISKENVMKRLSQKGNWFTRIFSL